MVPVASGKVPRAPPYSGYRSLSHNFVYRTCTFFGRPFNAVLLSCRILLRGPTTPISIGLASSPFARRYLGNHSYFLFLQVLRCFSSLGCLRRIYVFLRGNWTLLQLGSPIRISPDLCVLTTPRSVSPFVASFFVS